MPEQLVNKSKEFYNNAPELTPLTGGKPTKGWNAIMMRGKGGRPEAYSSGKQIYPTAGAAKDWPVKVSAGKIVKAALELMPAVAVKNAQTKLAADSLFEDMKLRSLCLKLAGEDNEPRRETGGPPKALRPRAEVIICTKDGAYAIDKGDYILFPGGGVADGETAEGAVIRETLEECGRIPLSLEKVEVKECIWPEDDKDEFKKSSKFDGERSHFFIAIDGGDSELSHKDREDFKVIPWDTLQARLQNLISDKDQSWAVNNNECRYLCVERGKRLANHSDPKELPKLAAQMPPHQMQQPQPIQMPAPIQPQKANIQNFVGQLVNNFKQRLKPLPIIPQAPVKQAQLGEGKKDSEFNSKQLEMGKDIETEHTDNEDKAKAIAKDHLVEIPDYYTRLDEMEKEAEKEGKKQAAEQELEARVVEIVKNFDGKSNWSEYLKTAKLDVSDAELAHALRLALIKTGDIAQYMPRSEYLMVTPDGKVVTKKLPARRYTFPTEGSGTPALYEPNLKFIPEAGIPTSGYHGYDIGFNVGETEDVPEGYEALPALDVLKDLYGSMGIAANRPYQNLDRARARVLLRYLKRRAKNKIS